MSYILEALKKAQAERQLGSAPDIHAAPVQASGGAGGGLAASRKPLLVGLGAGALVVAVVVAGAVLLSHRTPVAVLADAGAPQSVAAAPSGAIAGAPQSAAVPQTSGVGAAPPSPAASAAGASATLAVSAPDTPAPAPAPAIVRAPDARAPAPRAADTRASAPPAPAGTRLDARAVANVGLGAGGQPPAAASASAPASASQPAAAPMVAARQPATPAAAPATAPATAPARPPEDSLPFLQQLPESIQSQIPRVTFGGSMYSANPSDRLLLVDKGLRHEGEEVAPGLVLEKLLPRAAVMNFRGVRYRVGL